MSRNGNMETVYTICLIMPGNCGCYQPMKGKCRGDYEESNYNIRSVNRKYGRQLSYMVDSQKFFLSRVVKEARSGSFFCTRCLYCGRCPGRSLSQAVPAFFG